MSEEQKRRKILAAIAAASMLGGAAPAVGAPDDLVEIKHKGNKMLVACSALEGHMQHADVVEKESIELVDGCSANRPRKETLAKERNTKREQEQKIKHGSTGFADAEHQANREMAAGLVELLGNE